MKMTRTIFGLEIVVLVGLALLPDQPKPLKSKLAASGVDVYTVETPNADPSHGSEGKLAVEKFGVGAKRYITGVEQECLSGELCGWSYHRFGGYSIDYELKNGGTEVVWYRHSTSFPTKYRIMVHWATI